MKLLSRIVATALSALAAGPSAAHEFWIGPRDFTIAPGATLTAALRVGERFEGTPQPYIPRNFDRFDIATGDGEPRAVAGRIGDRPALQLEVEEPGLATILHVTRDYRLEWESWETFESFVTHKDAEWVLDAHLDRGFAAADGIVEVYSRYAKSLVAVGDGAGQDRAHGLLTEIVALENPYTGTMRDGLDIRLLYEGEPRTGAQVEIFARAPEGAVTVSTARTDDDGVATIPVQAGATYLLDAVVLRAPDEDLVAATGARWESLWASLTFAVPADQARDVAQ